MSSWKEDPYGKPLQQFIYTVAADATGGADIVYPVTVAPSVPIVRLTYLSGVKTAADGVVSEVTSSQFTLTCGNAADRPRYLIQLY